MTRNIENLPDLMTVDEMADYTQLSIPTLARWRMEHTGPRFLKLGGSIRYRKTDVLLWLDSLNGANDV